MLSPITMVQQKSIPKTHEMNPALMLCSHHASPYTLEVTCPQFMELMDHVIWDFRIDTLQPCPNWLRHSVIVPPAPCIGSSSNWTILSVTLTVESTMRYWSAQTLTRTGCGFTRTFGSLVMARFATACRHWWKPLHWGVSSQQTGRVAEGPHN